MSAQIVFGFIWKVSVPIERYSCMNIAVKCDVTLSKTVRNPKVLSPIFADPWSRKLRSPNSSARSPPTRDLSGLGFMELQSGHIFTRFPSPEPQLNPIPMSDGDDDQPRQDGRQRQRCRSRDRVHPHKRHKRHKRHKFNPWLSRSRTLPSISV